MKMAMELLEILAPADVDVDKAEEATGMLGGDNPTKELMDVAEKAVAKASEHLGAAVKAIALRKKNASGTSLEEIQKLEARALRSQKRLNKIKGTFKEAHERAGCEMLMNEAAEKLQSVQDAVHKAPRRRGPS